MWEMSFSLSGLEERFMLRLQNVSKRYTKSAKPAVNSLTLEVKPGEIFGFIGANGAGKTTTIKMMTGILAIDEGNIEIFGHDIAKDPIAAKRCIGFVSDNHEVYERLSGLEYLDFLADVYGVSAEQRKARMEEYLDLFELGGAIRDPIKSYSHGMKQKLCLIGALLHDPPLWVLDEPMTGLDPQSSHRLKQAMRAHCDAGNIVFFSTHVLDVAERLCDRVGIIAKGELIAVGTLGELRSRGRGDTGESLEDLFLSLTSQGGDE